MDNKPLFKLSPKEWEEIAIKYEDYLNIFKMIMEYPTCFMCSFSNPKNVQSLEFHLKSTHGFTLDSIIRAKLQKNGGK